MARIASTRRLVHPTAANITIPVEEGDAWVFGPGAGRWWRWFAWWVIPLGAALLIGGWWPALSNLPLFHPLALPAAPVHRPSTARPTAPRPVPVPSTPATVDLTPVGQGLQAVAEAVRDLQEARQPVATQPAGQFDQPLQQRSAGPDRTSLTPREAARCRLWNQQQ